jgi:hypothetical protein
MAIHRHRTKNVEGQLRDIAVDNKGRLDRIQYDDRI